MFWPTIAPLFHVLIILGLFLNVTTIFKTRAITDICSLLGNFSYVYRKLPCARRSYTEHDGRATGPSSLCFFAPSIRT